MPCKMRHPNEPKLSELLKLKEEMNAMEVHDADWLSKMMALNAQILRLEREKKVVQVVEPTAPVEACTHDE